MVKCLDDNRGFSLVEILVVIAVFGILIVLGFVNYKSFGESVDLSTSANHIISILHLAADRTMSSKADTVYGVHFTSSTYTLFKGATYSAVDPNNEDYSIPSSVEIYNISLNGGGADVIFDRITGETSNNGDIDLRIIGNTSEVKKIDILPTGIAGYEGTSSPTGTRVTDARHTHFDLGWSLQGANTLTLYFNDSPDPNVQLDVAMSGFFNPGQTEFDWTSSTININGETQSLRIHTHSLDAFDTQLCIHRDGRYNDKNLDVSVDAKDIASYTAGGSVSVGSFGGTMTEQ